MLLQWFCRICNRMIHRLETVLASHNQKVNLLFKNMFSQNKSQFLENNKITLYLNIIFLILHINKLLRKLTLCHKVLKHPLFYQYSPLFSRERCWRWNLFLPTNCSVYACARNSSVYSFSFSSIFCQVIICVIFADYRANIGGLMW